MPLNCSIFQDDIAKVNANMDQAKEGARDMLDSKQLRLIAGKSKYMVIGPPESRIKLI